MRRLFDYTLKTLALLRCLSVAQQYVPSGFPVFPFWKTVYFLFTHQKCYVMLVVHPSSVTWMYWVHNVKARKGMQDNDYCWAVWLTIIVVKSVPQRVQLLLECTSKVSKCNLLLQSAVMYSKWQIQYLKVPSPGHIANFS